LDLPRNFHCFFALIFVFLICQIVIEPERRAGVVLVTANNPHLTRLPRSTAFCPDRCEELGWAAQLTARNKVTLPSSTFLCG
jgi:hypothetical protein